MSWEQLAQVALLGAANAPMSPARVAPEADALLEALSDADDPARTLLRRAAVLGLAIDAGRAVTKPAVPTPAACPDETRRELPSTAALLFNQALDGTRRPLLGALVRDLARKDFRIPPALLPAALELGRDTTSRAELRPGLCRVADWLAGLNERWAWATGADDSAEVFANGSGPARRAAFAQLRREDPNAAREALTQGFAKESPEDRAAFVQAFAEGLSMADEPFLEAALDDRRKEVRSGAAELQSRLPESALSARMRDRAQPLLVVTRKLLRTELELVLPEACDKAMQRDGIEPKPPHAQIGERAWWAAQILARVPPAFWHARTQRDAAQLLPLLAKNEFKAMFLIAYALSVHRFADLAAARAWLADPPHAAQEVAQHFDSDILPVLALAADYEAIVLERIANDAAFPSNYLALLPAPWSAKLSRALVQRLRDAKQLERWTRGMTWHLPSGLALAAQRITPSPDMLDDSWPGLPESQAHVNRALEDLASALHFRLQFIQILERP